jgi:hypothetical protein
MSLGGEQDNPEGGEHGPSTAVGRPWGVDGRDRAGRRGVVVGAPKLGAPIAATLVKTSHCSGNQCRRGSLVRDYRMPPSPWHPMK